MRLFAFDHSGFPPACSASPLSIAVLRKAQAKHKETPNG